MESENVSADAQILAALLRIENLLMHIANNTQDAVPVNQGNGVTRFYPGRLE